ncbi:hypothetical protein MJ560_20355 [Klebsiella pneumoniae]|nr:hypothetical protein MJ560_20355 [Klebsiella pneumoniae]
MKIAFPRGRWRSAEHIRREGEKEMERDALALLWSAIAATGAFLIDGGLPAGEGNFSRQTGGDPEAVFLLENLGYTFGFIIVIMARQLGCSLKIRSPPDCQ